MLAKRTKKRTKTLKYAHRVYLFENTYPRTTKIVHALHHKDIPET